MRPIDWLCNTLLIFALGFVIYMVGHNFGWIYL